MFVIPDVKAPLFVMAGTGLDKPGHDGAGLNNQNLVGIRAGYRGYACFNFRLACSHPGAPDGEAGWRGRNERADRTVRNTPQWTCTISYSPASLHTVTETASHS